MFRCDFCGFSSDSPKAKFCANCGPNGPAAKWKADQVNREENISRFSNLYGSVFTNAPKDSKNQILELRRKLKISFDVWEEIETHYATYSTSTDRDWPISLRYRFAENEAFAGQDALIEFEVENLTDNHFFKVDIEWDDPGTFRVDLKAISDQYVPPASTTNLSASVVFDRSGPKQIKGTKISIVDEAGEKRTYAVEAIRISIQNPSLSIQNTVNNTNSISIQGRGVVDAQGLGSEKSSEATTDNQSGIAWKALAISPLVDHDELARLITSRMEQEKQVFTPSQETKKAQSSEPNSVFSHDDTRPYAQNPSDTKAREPDQEDHQFAERLEAISAVSLRMVQHDHFTTSLVLDVPASTALRDASFEIHVERGDKVTSKTLALTLAVGEHRREFLCLEDGIAAFTNQFVQFNEHTDVELEFLTILRADPSSMKLECLEEDGLLFLKETPHNVLVELSELAHEIIEEDRKPKTSDPSNSKWVRHLAGTGDFGWSRHMSNNMPSDYTQIGTAVASDFGWELPLILSVQDQPLGTISRTIKNGEQLVAVGDNAGPWEKSRAFATIAATSPPIDENEEHKKSEEPDAGETAGAALEIATGDESKTSGKTKFFVVMLILGLVGSFFVWQQNQNTHPSVDTIALSQTLHEASRDEAIRNARENTTLSLCSTDGSVLNCFGTWNGSPGHKYVGEFFNNKRHGWGVYIWPDGYFYVGNWAKGRRSGFGTIFYENGSTKEGIWSWDGENYSLD